LLELKRLLTGKEKDEYEKACWIYLDHGGSVYEQKLLSDHGQNF